jgi:putative hemolysin
MIDVGSARGTIKDGEKEILHNVFEFDNKSAGEVMTHRRDTVLLRLEDSDEEWEKTIMESKHGFFPVCGKDTDDIIWVLDSRDYLCLSDRRRGTVMALAVTPAQFVPTFVRTDMLFNRMKKNRNHFAVVLDEHGGTMGIITMKDLLEELVGSLENDSTIPPEQPLIIKTGPETWLLNGAIPLEKAAKELEVNFPVDRYDTFAGFVFSLLGSIPEDGSQIELETGEVKIKCLEIRDRRLEKALVAKTEQSMKAES